MQQLDIFEIIPGALKQPGKKAAESSVSPGETQASSHVMTNPMGTEMVVNDQIKVKVKQIKPVAGEKKTDAIDNLELIERIKAKLRREFDLTTPVERNDDDYKKTPKQRSAGQIMESFAAPLNIPPDEELYKKQYYTMGQVSEMFHVNQSMLRSWENEFDIVKPKKNKKGDRYFRPADIKSLELIYHLLRNRKFTIDGAKTFLKQHRQKAVNTFTAIQSLEKLKSFLIEYKNNL